MGFGRGKGFSPVAPPVTPKLQAYYGTFSNRDIWSTHGTWSLARGGINLSSNYNYLPPNLQIIVATWLTASYFIHQGWLFFDTSPIPTGATIISAKLSLYIVNRVYQIGGSLYITQGIQGDPILLSDFGAQTDLTTVGGSKKFADLVVGQYNDIDLNAAGLGWINAAGAILRQFESFDSGENADQLVRGTYWWCMTFTPRIAHRLKSIKLKMWRVGSPGTITVSIKAADANHFPTGAALCSGTYNGNTLTTVSPGQWYEVTLGTGFDMVLGTEYAIEVKAPSGDASNRVLWRANTAGQYLGGRAAFSDNSGSTWTSYAAHDNYFVCYNPDLASTKGTKLCLRTSSDNNNSPPYSIAEDSCRFSSGQRGENYRPKLTVSYQA